MLQANMLDERNLTATSLPAMETDVIEATLSFDPESGNFTFSSPAGASTLDSMGIFRIAMSDPRTITINAGPGIEFVSGTPFKPFSLNNSGALQPGLASSTQITIDVTILPSLSGLLGFVLIVQTTSNPIVQRIQTPPFLITPNQSFPELNIGMSYDRLTGVFEFTNNEIPAIGNITLEKGLVIFRFHDGSSPAPAPDIRVFLETAGVVFAPEKPAVFNSASGAHVARISDTELSIVRDFTSGTAFCVSFGVQLSGEPNPTVVYSPDPIIIDKQIGGSG